MGNRISSAVYGKALKIEKSHTHNSQRSTLRVVFEQQQQQQAAAITLVESNCDNHRCKPRQPEQRFIAIDDDCKLRCCRVLFQQTDCENVRFKN